MTEEEEIMEAMSTTSTFLPQDIVMEILSRLPAKSLVCSFKLVCKAWCTIIKDPDFIKMHLNRRGGGRSRYNNESSLVRKDRHGNSTLFQLHPPFVNCEAKKMDIDSNLLILKSRLVGSCNGLLCLSVNNDESIIILNPSTRKYKVSPENLIQYSYRLNPYLLSHRLATYGFGCYYNSTTTIDEYKVVRIVYFDYPRGQSFEIQIDIYSMSSNSWRRWWCREVKDMTCKQFQEGSGVFLNGAVHWMGNSKLRNAPWNLSSALDTIVSFNIRDEEFGQVQMPPPNCADVDEDGRKYPGIFKDDKITLMNIRGCLGKVYFCRTKMMHIELEIWVMKEYGIGESWTKEFVIRTSDSDPLRELPAGLCMLTRYMTCFLTGDDKILIEVRVGAGSKDYGRRVLYDMNKMEIDGDFIMFDMPSEHYKDDRVDYIETLVSLKSSNNRKRKDTESLRNQPFEDVLYFKQQLEGIIYF